MTTRIQSEYNGEWFTFLLNGKPVEFSTEDAANKFIDDLKYTLVPAPEFRIMET